MLHNLSHWLGWNTCRLAEIRHRPDCDAPDIERLCCDWSAIVVCETCGRITELAEGKERDFFPRVA